MPSGAVNVLLVDDDDEDAFITEELLRDAPGRFVLTWLPTYEAAIERAREFEFDVCLVDYRIGGETGLEFLRKATNLGISAPMILLTGVGQHDVDVAASEVGAADFLDKSTLTSVLLERAIRYAIAHARALSELAEQKRILATTLESVQGGILAVDASGQPLASNQRFHDLMETLRFARPSGEVGSDVSGSKDFLQTITDRTENEIFEIEASDGSAVEFRVSPVPGGGNVVLGVDITAQKTLQRKILEAKVAAETANKTKSAFLAKISHELRTPLNGVFGMAQLLKLTPLNAEQISHVDGLLRSAMGLMVLIEDLLDISIIEQGEFKISMDSIDLYDVVRAAIDVTTAASSNQDVRITEKIHLSSPGTFTGDAKRIQQVLTNFLSNATKHTSRGRIEVSVHETGDGWVRFTVKDDGPGIPAEDHERIFEKFTQLKDRDAKPGAGVGLGLSIAKEMVEQMHGRIGVASVPGSGAEFWFELPTHHVDLSLGAVL
jgi:signal transduction histidine kinase